MDSSSPKSDNKTKVKEVNEMTPTFIPVKSVKGDNKSEKMEKDNVFCMNESKAMLDLIDVDILSMMNNEDPTKVRDAHTDSESILSATNEVHDEESLGKRTAENQERKSNEVRMSDNLNGNGPLNSLNHSSIKSSGSIDICSSKHQSALDHNNTKMNKNPLDKNLKQNLKRNRFTKYQVDVDRQNRLHQAENEIPSTDVTSRLVSTIKNISKSAQIENESTKAFEEYSIEINPSYGTDSDVSSLPDGEIVSDSDEFVDAIQSHYLLVGERSAMTELDDAESLSSYENLFFDLETDMVYGDSDYSEGSDFGEEEVHDEDVDEEEEEEKEDEQIDEIDAISTPRPSSFVLSRGLSSRRFNFKRPKLSFRKQAVRNIESLNMDFPKLARNKSRKKKEDKKKRQPHSRDLESVSSSTVSSKSFSVSTLSTFVPPAPFGEPEGNLPTSFLPPRQQNDQEQKSNPLSIYFDKQLFENGIPSLMTTNFYTEHAIFIQAVLQLLDEREKVGVEAAADDPNTIKSGPLKKKMSLRNGKGGFGRLGWKMKYVEIRKGMFSYYQNSKISEGKLVRRNISLRANTCSCRCSPKLDQGNSGFAFELIDESGTITTWMSNSKEGRNAWIRAINEGMIGKPNLLKNNEDEGPSVENNSLPSSRCSMKPLLSSKNSFDPLGSSTLFADGKGIDKYSIIQNLVYSAKTKDEYLNAFEDLWGNSFQIPSNIINLKKNKSKRVVISQLWKQLSRGTYSINNHILRGDTPYGPERTLGGLTRCILEYDQTHLDTITSATNFSPISEVQAINYARDILGSCTDISMDRCLTAVEDLCLCSNLVSLVPFLSEIKPINLIVTHTDGNSEIGSIDGNKIFGNELEKSGWLTTRNRSHRNWRTLFCVLSEGVLSYYEEESPRPHLLKGQFVLMGAKMYVSEVEVHAREEKEISSSNTSTTCYVIRLIARNGSKERLFILKEKEELNSWRAALENMIGLSSPESNTISPTDTEKKDVYKIMENDESEDRRLQKKNLADIFRDAVQRGVGSNIPFSVNELGGEIERTISMPPSKDVNILSRLRPRVNSGDIIVRPDSGGKDFQTQLESRIKQLRKPLLHVFKSGHSSVVPDMKEDFSNQQQKPSVMIKVETSTVYRICSLKSEGNLTDDTWGLINVKFQKKNYLSGGAKGKLEEGHENVQMEFYKGCPEEFPFETDGTI